MKAELEEISDRVNRVYIEKFDDTQDFYGALTARNQEGAIKLIEEKFNYLKAKKHKSSQTCL